MLQYHRLNTIYDKTMARGKRGDFDPSDLVRVLPAVEARDDKALVEHLQNHWMLPLSEGARGQVLLWWELVIVPNKDKKGPSAILRRSHHALADGISMVSIVQEIITDMDGNSSTASYQKV
jgi:hypothetical protein